MEPEATAQPAAKVPLVLDLDGTLLRTDLLHETFWAALGHDTAATLRVSIAHIGSPSRLKHELAAIATPCIDLLPLEERLLERVHAALGEGRPVHLVSGSAQGLVDAVAARLGLPGPHFGSDRETNLTGDAKAGFLAQRFGTGRYDYAGNSDTDMKAWEGAREIIAVAPSQRLRHRLEDAGKPINIIRQDWKFRVFLQELRPSHWAKNALLFVPLLVAHDLDPGGLAQVALAALAFSLGASAIYILNDLLDLESDRRHPEKRNRPIASGLLPIQTATGASAVLVLLALIIALGVSPAVGALTLLYMTGSLTYSLMLKKRRWLDVLALALFFMLRVFTGAVAAGVPIPPILLALGFTVFLALACAKRLTALSRLGAKGPLPGRGYSPADLMNLERIAYGSIAMAALLFLFYASGPRAAELYANPVLLAFAVIPLVIWLLRIVRLGIEGREDYDTVAFVLHDRAGWAILLAGLILIVLAI